MSHCGHILKFLGNQGLGQQKLSRDRFFWPLFLTLIHDYLFERFSAGTVKRMLLIFFNEVYLAKNRAIFRRFAAF